MAVTYSNMKCSHRGCYYEVVGDGVTTALTTTHRGGMYKGTTATASVVKTPSGKVEYPSGKGGFAFPSGTAVAVSSVTVNPTANTTTVNTTAALANGLKAYVVVLFDQPSSAN